MSRIVELETQIQFIEAELAKLRQERIELQSSLPVPVSDVPEEIVATAKKSAVAVAQRQPQLQGVQDAIALLERRLLPLQREFDQLAAKTDFQSPKK